MKNPLPCLAAFVALLAFEASAFAQAYLVKPVRLIVPNPPGGGADLVARMIGQKLTETLGQTFVVDNRGGVGGVIGEELAARSAPDGYTVLFVSLAHVVNQAMQKKLPYDPMRDLMPVSLLVSAPNVLMVHRAVPAQAVPALIALVKAKPGELNYASSHGTSLHIAGELFKSMAGVDIVNVNYKNGAMSIPDLEAGRVQMTFSVITVAQSLVKTGRTRALAVTSAKRSAIMPDLPAIAEFIPGYELTGWSGLLAPAGTPHAIVARLADQTAKIMRMPEVRAKLIGMGADPIGSTPEIFASFRKAELAKLAKLVSTAGIKAEF